MRKSIFIVCVSHVVVGLVPREPINTRDCRCRPNEPCWPSQDEWKSLNYSIQGNLVSVRPAAAACHDPEYNEAACKAAQDGWGASTWRSTQPGAVQWTNWETWPERNETCYVDTGRSTRCGQGRISLYSAVVQTPAHIQAVVRFAKMHNIRLAIKNTGHCFLGRSTAPESLQIATYKMKNISFTEDFYLSGAPSCRNVSAGSAVTIGAGVQLADLYSAVSAKNKSVAVGLSVGVGAAGGYIQGGGHGPLGPWKGMASDNALEFSVVLANGDLVVANEHQHRDLFWALRGGGGGTFGVVVAATIRTFDDVPAQIAQLTVQVPKTKSQQFWKLVEVFHKSLPALSDGGASGYYSVTPPSDAPGLPASPGFSLSATLYFVNITSNNHAKELLGNFTSEGRKYSPASNLTVKVDPVPRITQTFHQQLAEAKFDAAGFSILDASRLVSRDFLMHKDGPGRVANAMQEIYTLDNTVRYQAHLVAGGAVASSKVDSALNPAWRRTLSHLSFGKVWFSNTTLAEQAVIKSNITNVLMPHLRNLEPDMGAYLNEADAYEPEFQRSFWGKNYARLYRIKQELDPDGLFITRKGVGSEDWDENGLCRVHVQ